MSKPAVTMSSPSTQKPTGATSGLPVVGRVPLNGKTYLSPDIAEKVVSGYLDGGKGLNPVSAWDSLTLREREVLKLIAEGQGNKHIANYLCVSVKTVEKHRSNLMRKLNLHNAAVLTSFAIEKGMVSTS